MDIAIFGSGYVGLVSGISFASLGHNVVCVDSDEKKIDRLKKGEAVIHETGLTDLLTQTLKDGRIRFTTSAKEAINQSAIIFLALPTPSLADGRANISYLQSVAKTIGQTMVEYKIIVNKSTAPVGTLKKLYSIIAQETEINFDVVSNPEFLKEGTAINDFLVPDRIIIGSESEQATKVMKDLYRPLLINGHELLVMNITSAEITKYASNGMLALRISFMNQIANLCDTLGGDIDDIRKGVSKDNRIGTKFLYAGIGYGGSCFPKDVKALIKMGEEHNVDMSLATATYACNLNQAERFVYKIKKYFNGSLSHKKLAVWGLTFKPNTDDIRESPSLVIIKKLLDMGAGIKAHDPVAIEKAKSALPKNVQFFNQSYDVLDKADALLLMTEWPAYRNPDYKILKEKMKNPVIFDGRNVLNMQKVIEEGFTYYGIGKNMNLL